MGLKIDIPKLINYQMAENETSQIVRATTTSSSSKVPEPIGTSGSMSVRKSLLGAGEVRWQLSLLPAPPEAPSSVPSTLVECVTVMCDSDSR